MERLLVEIDRDSDPIRGFVRRLDGEGPARQFSGYIELIAALERVGHAEAHERGD